MSLHQTFTHPCPRCRTPNAYDVHASIHLDGADGTRAVLTNRFNVYGCASCGLLQRLESDVLVVDRARDAYFQVLLRDEDVAPYLAKFRETAPGARLRVVDSRDALVEKVRLWVLGLDDVAYECVKFAMRINQRDLEGTLVLRFDHVENDQLLFFAQRPDGTSGLLPMPMHVYHRMASDLNTAGYAAEPEVDERLARRLLDAPRPAPAAPQPTTPAEPRRDVPSRRALRWSDFVRASPCWSDVERVAAPCRTAAPRPVLPPHPLFAPWAAQIVASAPTCVDLSVYGSAKAQPCEPTREDSFSHGRVAFLDQPNWPACGLCSRPLEMCIQVSPTVMAQFVGGGHGLVALLCFACVAGGTNDPRCAHICFVNGTHRVSGPESWTSSSSLPAVQQSQRVTALAPSAALPDSMWLKVRGEKVESASALLMRREVELVDAPAEGTAGNLKKVDKAYDEWSTPARPGSRGARLGGTPRWAQYDRTPSCAHGEMLHLLEYDGGQFLDGALHVFLCRKHACGLSYVAEF